MQTPGLTRLLTPLGLCDEANQVIKFSEVKSFYKGLNPSKASGPSLIDRFDSLCRNNNLSVI